MDEILTEIDIHNTVKRDLRSLTRYATTITVFVWDLENNGRSVQEAYETPFMMSKLLSKLQPRDNCEFGRETQREKKKKRISPTWSIGLIVKQACGCVAENKTTVIVLKYYKSWLCHKSANNFGKVVDDDTCPMNCTTKHLLNGCPVYHSLSVSQRWDTLKNHKKCRVPSWLTSYKGLHKTK